MRRIAAVHQVVPVFAPRDAIGDNSLQIHRLLRERGYRAELYGVDIAPDADPCVRPFADYPAERQADTVLLYHHSTGHRGARMVLRRPEPLLVDYHNITPAEMFLPWNRRVALELASGRRQTAALAAGAVGALADSAYNAAELTDLGMTNVEVAPIMRELGPSIGSRTPPTGPLRLLFVGRLAPNKAQEDLLRILAVCRRVYDPQASLDLVGSASDLDYRAALVSLTERFGLLDAVRFHEGLTLDELHDLYRRASVFVCASRHEGFCVPLIEAMHHRLPIVARAGSAVTGTLDTGGLVLDGFDPWRFAAAVHRVGTDPAVWSDLSRRAAARGRDFALPVTQRAFEAALDRVLSRLRPAAGLEP